MPKDRNGDKIVSKQELFEIIEDDRTIEVDREKHHRHNMEFVTVVAYIDDKPYMGTYTIDGEWGMTDEDVEFSPAKCEKVVVDKWSRISHSL